MTTSAAWLVATLCARRARRVRRVRRSQRLPTSTRLRGDLGEGVISAAIAVLIMAFLGALMWVGFQKMWVKTEARTNHQIDQISTDR